jgi:acyl dehydratase
MPLDPAYIGRSFPPTEPYYVSREKIREFATAIGAESPLHRDPEAARAAGYRDVIAPLTFPILLASATLDQFLSDPGLGIDFSRVVHGDERFVYHRQVVAGDEITCVGTVLEIMARAGNEFISTSTAIATTAGELVTTTFSKLVIRGES